MSSTAKVFKRVKHEGSDGRPPIQYRIQIIDEPLFEEAVSFMVKYFVPHGNIPSGIGLTSDKEALEEFKDIYRRHLSHKISLAAVLEDEHGNTGPIIGCNILTLNKTDNQNKITFRTEKCRKIYETKQNLERRAQMAERYNCSSFVMASGLAVPQEYAGRGIMGEMLKVRDDICRLAGTPISATVFAGDVALKAAARSGYETLVELDITDYRMDGELVFTNPKYRTVVWMAKRHY